MQKKVLHLKKHKKHERTAAVFKYSDKSSIEQNEKKDLPGCVDYPSAEMALQVVMNECNSAFDRGNALATRGGVLLSAILAAFTISLASLKFDILINPPLCLKCNPNFYIYSLLVIIYVIASILSVIFLIQSVNTMTYQAVNCDDINDNKYLSLPKDKIAVSIIRSLTKNLKTSDINNSKRSRYYKVGAWMSASTVIIYILVKVFQELLIK